MKNLVLYLTVSCLISCSGTENERNEDENAMNNPLPPVIGYSVVNTFPHDTASFTEGLLVHEGQLYESTGSPQNPPNNGSWWGPVDLQTGKAIRKVRLENMYFGEGISILNGKVYQLTYQHHKGFVYDAGTFRKVGEFAYRGEGWSLTNDGRHLIMSDGTSNLRYLDSENLRVIKLLNVQDNNGPVANINELEFINGHIYANIWLTNYVVQIDTASGRVLAKLDFSTLANEAKIKYPGSNELNGIAHDKQANRVFVTGKCWPTLYEVRF